MDIRINTTFRDHRKRKRLIRRLGHKGVVALLDLWLVTADNNPDGLLSGYTNEDIADDSGWDGEPDEFVNALRDTGFLDTTANGYKLHNWEDHQQWVISAEARRIKARNAAKKRWQNLASDDATGNAPSMPQAMLNDESSNAPNLTQPNQDLTKTQPNPPPPFPPTAPTEGRVGGWVPDELCLKAIAKALKNRYSIDFPDITAYKSILIEKSQTIDPFAIEALCGWLGEYDWTLPDGQYVSAFSPSMTFRENFDKIMSKCDYTPPKSPEEQEEIRKRYEVF